MAMIRSVLTALLIWLSAMPASSGIDKPWQEAEPESAATLCQQGNRTEAEIAKCMRDMRKPMPINAESHRLVNEWVYFLFMAVMLGAGLRWLLRKMK